MFMSLPLLIISYEQSVGSLQVVCELVKAGSTSQVIPHAPLLLDIARSVESNKALTNNTLVRKFRIKLLSRVVLRLLPPRRRAGLRRGMSHANLMYSVTDV